MGGLTVLVSAISGTIFLKNDEVLRPCFGRLMDSPIGMCTQGGMVGMQCMMPYAFISGANAFIDLISFFPIMFSLNVSFPFLVLWACDIAQFAGLYWCWQIYQLTQSASPGGGYQSLGGGGASGADGNGDQGLFGNIANAFGGGGGGGNDGGTFFIFPQTFLIICHVIMSKSKTFRTDFNICNLINNLFSN